MFCCLFTIGGLLITFIVTICSQSILFVRILHFKKVKRKEQATLPHTSTLASKDKNTELSSFSKTTRNVTNANSTTTIQEQWNFFLDDVRTAFNVSVACLTYILAFILGAAVGTALTIAYQEERKSCTVFTNLNIYAWTVVVTVYMSCFAANPYIYGLRNNDICNDFKGVFSCLNPVKRRGSFRPGDDSKTSANRTMISTVHHLKTLIN